MSLPTDLAMVVNLCTSAWEIKDKLSLKIKKEYIHRVGRTARGLDSSGNAVILLRPEEEKFVDYLKREKVYLDKYSFGDPPDDVQKMLEDVIEKDGTMKILARKAYLSFLRCYTKHSQNEVFDIKNLDLKLAARAFGFLEQPHVDFLKTRKRKKTDDTT